MSNGEGIAIGIGITSVIISIISVIITVSLGRKSNNLVNYYGKEIPEKEKGNKEIDMFFYKNVEEPNEVLIVNPKSFLNLSYRTNYKCINKLIKDLKQEIEIVFLRNIKYLSNRETMILNRVLKEIKLKLSKNNGKGGTSNHDSSTRYNIFLGLIEFGKERKYIDEKEKEKYLKIIGNIHKLEFDEINRTEIYKKDGYDKNDNLKKGKYRKIGRG